MHKSFILKLIYKINHNDLPSYMSVYMTKSQLLYSLRRTHQLVIPSFKTNAMKFSIEGHLDFFGKSMEFFYWGSTVMQYV